MPAPCHREVERDETGYTVYETLIWRNDPWLRDGVIYARDLGPEKNASLIRRYPARELFLYTRTSPDFGSKPRLQRLTVEAPALPNRDTTQRVPDVR
jgi:hypothetical protein